MLPSGRTDRLRDDAGATLVETLVALVILGIAAVAILAGLQLSQKSSDINRKQSTSGAYVRSYAEAIQKSLNTNGNYQACAAANAYNTAAVLAAVSDLPSTYNTPQQAAAVPLDGKGAPLSGSPCPDTGVQRLNLSISSKDGRATERLTVVVRRCGPGAQCN